MRLGQLIKLVLKQCRDVSNPNDYTRHRDAPHSPEFNPVESVWLHHKKRFLSHRLLDNYDTIIEAGSNAWKRFIVEAGRIKSLCSYPWISKINEYARLYRPTEMCVLITLPIGPIHI